MKKTVILLVIAVLPILSFGQIYISEVLDGLVFVGPTNVSNTSGTISKEYRMTYILMQKHLGSLRVEQEDIIRNLENKISPKRRKIKAAEAQIELIEKEMRLLDELQLLWQAYNQYNHLTQKLFEHLQNKKCATIVMDSDTLSVGDYEIRVDTVEVISELIPIKEGKKQAWKKIEQDGKEIWCLTHEDSYSINNHGMMIEIEQCPLNFEFSEHKKYCQQKSQLDFGETILDIRIFNTETKEEVFPESWQASDCQ